jgi:hypothetical protein
VSVDRCTDISVFWGDLWDLTDVEAQVLDAPSSAFYRIANQVIIALSCAFHSDLDQRRLIVRGIRIIGVL